MSQPEITLVVAGIAATATITAAAIASLSSYFSSKRDRRRVLYGEAFKAAMGWIEMLARVRRRSGNDDAALVERFHDLQEALTYHAGWIGSESRYMARSYRRLVNAVKMETEPLIRVAWDEPVRPAPGNATEADEYPQFDSQSEAFLKDVRGYLSPWQTRKLWVWCRNKDQVDGR